MQTLESPCLSGSTQATWTPTRLRHPLHASGSGALAHAAAVGSSSPAQSTESGQATERLGGGGPGAIPTGLQQQQQQQHRLSLIRRDSDQTVISVSEGRNSVQQPEQGVQHACQQQPRQQGGEHYSQQQVQGQQQDKQYMCSKLGQGSAGLADQAVLLPQEDGGEEGEVGQQLSCAMRQNSWGATTVSFPEVAATGGVGGDLWLAEGGVGGSYCSSLPPSPPPFVELLPPLPALDGEEEEEGYGDLDVVHLCPGQLLRMLRAELQGEEGAVCATGWEGQQQALRLGTLEFSGFSEGEEGLEAHPWGAVELVLESPGCDFFLDGGGSGQHSATAAAAHCGADVWEGWAGAQLNQEEEAWQGEGEEGEQRRCLLLHQRDRRGVEGDSWAAAAPTACMVGVAERAGGDACAAAAAAAAAIHTPVGCGLPTALQALGDDAHQGSLDFKNWILNEYNVPLGIHDDDGGGGLELFPDCLC